MTRVVWVCLLSLASLGMVPPGHPAAMPQLSLVTARPVGPVAVQHPQAQIYASPADWPQIAFQGHWPRDPQPGPGLPARADLAHLHAFEMACPVYMVVTPETGTIQCPIQIMLYQVSGYLDALSGFGPARPTWAPSFLWDTTGSANLGPTAGNPTGLVIYSGTMTIDPSSWGTIAPHGWTAIHGATGMRFLNGDRMDCEFRLPVWSAMDPTQPESVNTNGNEGPTLITDCAFSSARGPSADNQQIRIHSQVPVAPVTAPYPPMRFNGARYGSTDKFAFLPDGTTECWLDPVLHMGQPGTLIGIASGNSKDGPVVLDCVLDPATMTAGDHKFLARWSQPIVQNAMFPGGELGEVLITVSFKAGTSGPPPTDTDGDGLHDGIDACPTIAGPAPTGCPPALPVAAMQTLLEQAGLLAQQWPPATRDQILILLAQILAVIGG